MSSSASTEDKKGAEHPPGFVPRLLSGDHADTASSQHTRFRPRSMAERSNLWWITALVYEPLWRRWSTRFLTRGRWSIDQELHMLVDMAAPQLGGSYLDAGCSTGLYARTLVGSVSEIRVTLVDYSEPMLRQARKRFVPSTLSKASFVQADLANLPFDDAVFQGVVFGGTLNECSEPEKVMSEMVRVLEPGGVCVVMHLSRHEKQEGLSGLLARGVRALLRTGGVILPDASWADALFKQAGLVMVNEQSAGWMRMVLLKKPAG